MDTVISQAEESNRNWGRIISTIVHIILIALMFYHWEGLKYQDPPEGLGGTEISFGQPEVGLNAPPAGGAEQEEEEEEVEPPVEEEVQPEEVVEEVVEVPKVEPKPKEKEREAQKELDRKKKIEREKELEKQKEIERKKEEARREQERRDKAKEDKKKLFGKPGTGSGGGNDNGTGAGAGNGGKPGNQGGDGNGFSLDGLGGASISGDLGGRGVLKKGTFNPPSQTSGVVNIRVCANDRGEVVSAKYTQGGSTIPYSNPNAKAAVKAAWKWKFDKGSGRDCGVLTYNIKLK